MRIVTNVNQLNENELAEKLKFNFWLAARWHYQRSFANIGTSYVDVYNTGLNGQRLPVNFSNYTQFKLVVHFNVIGSGNNFFRVVDESNLNNVLSELSASGNGEKEIETVWTNLPTWATREKYIKIQMKSDVGTDDPVFRGCSIYLK